MKILHIATDDKFLDHAVPVFEKVYPGSNEVFVFATKKPLKYVQLKPNYIEIRRNSFLRKKALVGKDVYSQYDVVIFHSLGSMTYPEIEHIPKNTPIVWLGWGFDYYVELLDDVPLYLASTQRLYNQFASDTFSRRAVSLVKKLKLIFNRRSSKIRAVERTTVFSPVLPEEYEKVKKSRKWRNFPKFALWNYGTIEDNLVKGFEGESVNGDAILVGNSATFTGNHIETFDLLYNLGVSDRQVVAPLSYGDPILAKKLKSLGQELFAEGFEPLMEFMSAQDYVAAIKKCGYVIMNHVRQQAVGNIVIMLYLGARVFVRQENPVYGFFKSAGVVISSVQELEKHPELLNVPLSEEERVSNRAIVSDYWSRERAYERTRELVEAAFAIKSINCQKSLAETRS